MDGGVALAGLTPEGSAKAKKAVAAADKAAAAQGAPKEISRYEEQEEISNSWPHNSSRVIIFIPCEGLREEALL